MMLSIKVRLPGRSILVIVLALLLLAACAPPATFPTVTPQLPIANVQSPTATAIPPTNTLPPPSTLSPIPTVTVGSSPTSTPTPSSTPTPTVTPTPTPLRFAVIGDYGSAGQPEQDVADLVHSWQPAFILTVGDNNYPDGEAETIDANIGQYYHDYIYPYVGEYGEGADSNRFFPTLGNHDWNTAGAQPHLDYFTLPGNERYYDFVWEPVHFFALDSDSREPDGFRSTSVQAEWLRTTLATASQPWKIVYMHHPPYSSGYHGSVTWMRWPFEEWGASIVLAGHDHVYERLEIDGFPYITAGLGGYPARYAFLLPIAGSRVRYNDDYGALLVEATAQQLTLQFIARSGELIDTYQLEQPLP